MPLGPLAVQGKSVLVTGASSGLGATTVKRSPPAAPTVAAAVVFLASDDASAIHGSIQLVDQGHLAG